MNEVTSNDLTFPLATAKLTILIKIYHWSTHHGVLWMLIEKLHLLLETCGQGNVVTIHASDVLALSYSQALVERGIESKVLLIAQKHDIGMLALIIQRHIIGIIFRAIITKDYLKILIGLGI
jgi:hypothetical protein